MNASKRQEEILKGKGKLKVFPVVRHTGKKEYYKSVRALEVRCDCGNLTLDESKFCKECI